MKKRINKAGILNYELFASVVFPTEISTCLGLKINILIDGVADLHKDVFALLKNP